MESFPQEKILIDNIRINKMNGAIKTRCGGWREADEETECR